MLQDLWDTALETGLDAEVRSRVTGAKAQMEKFSFFFGVYIGELVLGHTCSDNLSKMLQRKVISAPEAQKVAKLTVTTLTTIRNSKRCELFWKLVVQRASTFNVSEPALPRKRKAPSRYETGTGDSHFPCKVEDHFRQIYFEVLDLAISSIQTRFDPATWFQNIPNDKKSSYER